MNPHWLGYPYRWGPESTKTFFTEKDFIKLVGAAIGSLGVAVVPAAILQTLSNIIGKDLFASFYQDNLDGPEGPMQKDLDWAGQYRRISG
jgi:hypothetical protein